MASQFDLSKLLKDSPDLTAGQKLKFVARLSFPGIMAQLSSIAMQYIDAAMVGNLGESASASIGLTASSTWLLASLCSSMAIGFTIQTSHAVGNGDQDKAKRILKKSMHFCVPYSLAISLVAAALSSFLPMWLGGGPSIIKAASLYFLVYALSLPFYQMIYLMGGMLQCSGNVRVPGILNSMLCILDALFNVVFIKGFKLGVLGAALGSALSAVLIGSLMIYFAVCKSPYLGLTKGRGPSKENRSEQIISKALKLALPVAVQSVSFTGMLVIITKMIAPLGSVSLAANSFAVTAEALCYMPLYGLSDAAATLTGQSVGAERKDLAASFSWITVSSGMIMMVLTGVFMYIICPFVFKLLTPVEEIQNLSAAVLRIELFAEPLYGASIVAAGALRGEGDTLVPGILNMISLWIVRLGLSILLIRQSGLIGIWIAMACELCFRGIVMLIRLWIKNRRNRKI